jgi:hypothetical protein
MPLEIGTTATPAYMAVGTPSDLGTLFSVSATTNLVKVPAGNHLNALREPGHHPMLSYLVLDKTGGYGTDVTVQYRAGEFSGAQTTVTATDVPYETQHTSYKTHWYPIQKIIQRVQMTINKTPATAEATEIQNIGFVFQSEAGA